MNTDTRKLDLAEYQAAETRAILRDIQRVLDGQEWSSEDLETIANILRINGYPVRPPS